MPVGADPWSQIDFWRKSRNVDEGNFLRVV